MASSTVNALVLTNTLIEGLLQLQKLANLLQTAQAEGRDVSLAELEELARQDDVASAAFDKAIAAARAREAGG